MQDSVSDDELRKLIQEKAEEHNLPPELLLDIYEAEREVVNMDRRRSILKDVGALLEEEVDS
ncbi:DNA modification system-associated small protein [Natronococcus wangiae]|uniref:DNA modification system-associated small protein n=1 Tax=Natronococcus wangiae TaxID=3068275 RepID=UPI00273EBA2D|nr:DNA modification system-associated small protein [Natronococcus sp. AD5]